MTRALTFILLITMCFAIGYLLYIQGVQIQKQQAQYKELRAYINSHNSRLNVLEQRPELVIKEFKKPKGWGD